MIPYGRQNISEDDIQIVLDVLRSDRITQGPKVPEFEQAVADYCQASYAIATNSGTSTLHLACRALEVVEGDLVWTSPITFVALPTVPVIAARMWTLWILIRVPTI